MVKQDIRPIKNALREKYKTIRRDMDGEEKRRRDEQIHSRLLRIGSYQKAGLVLTFVSTSIEVDTHALISQALADGKRVAVPRCITGTRLMEFCEIDMFDDLEPRTFSVLEPKEYCRVISEFPNSVCIVPGLSFDMQGFRLGYGKGYYDRFLNYYPGITIGVCYSTCLHSGLPHGRYDRPVDLLVTEKFCKQLRHNEKGRAK